MSESEFVPLDAGRKRQLKVLIDKALAKGFSKSAIDQYAGFPSYTLSAILRVRNRIKIVMFARYIEVLESVENNTIDLISTPPAEPVRKRDKCLICHTCKKVVIVRRAGLCESCYEKFPENREKIPTIIKYIKGGRG